MAGAPLDEVAERLAGVHITIDRTVDELAARDDRFARLPRAVRLIVGVPAALLSVPRIVRSISSSPDREETLRLYCAVGGVDRDRAIADVAAVDARLGLLLNAPDALVRDAARSLVRWVASGRPASGPQQVPLEDKVMEMLEYRDRLSGKLGEPNGNALRVAEDLSRLSDEYEAAWRRVLDTPAH
jgi:hypothetical protein